MLLNKNKRRHGNNEAYAQLKTRNRFRERLHVVVEITFLKNEVFYPLSAQRREGGGAKQRPGE